MKDIATRADIETIMGSFYEKAFTDELIGFFFTKVAALDLEKHIPKITDFWETVLFDKSSYRGNILGVHEHIHSLSAFRNEHFDRWLEIFTQTVDALYAGENAEKVKQRAESIATVMKIKLVQPGSGVKIN